MTDRELLEMAAKAHGGLVYVDGIGWIHEDENGDRGSWWMPLTDDGDALRLMVKLNIHAYKGWASTPKGIVFDCRSNANQLAATRRAIVIAAAEIGKAMG